VRSPSRASSSGRAWGNWPQLIRTLARPIPVLPPSPAGQGSREISGLKSPMPAGRSGRHALPLRSGAAFVTDALRRAARMEVGTASRALSLNVVLLDGVHHVTRGRVNPAFAIRAAGEGPAFGHARECRAEPFGVMTADSRAQRRAASGIERDALTPKGGEGSPSRLVRVRYESPPRPHKIVRRPVARHRYRGLGHVTPKSPSGAVLCGEPLALRPAPIRLVGRRPGGRVAHASCGSPLARRNSVNRGAELNDA
jgi:hypothetical protein